MNLYRVGERVFALYRTIEGEEEGEIGRVRKYGVIGLKAKKRN